MNDAGLILEVSLASGATQSGVFVAYSRPPTAVKDVRPIVVEMHHAAYDALGAVYKLRSGYLRKRLQGKFTGTMKTPVGTVAIGAAVLGAAGLCLLVHRG